MLQVASTATQRDRSWQFIGGNKFRIDRLPGRVPQDRTQAEPLRKVAGDYSVSYETVRRVLHAARPH
jgi:hypothetical protein